MSAVVDWRAICAADDVRRLVDLAIAEDLGDGDVTTRSVFEAATEATGRIVARQPTVVCGGPLAVFLFHRFDAGLEVTLLAAEGSELPVGGALLEVRGDVRAILPAERCVLNFIMRSCGIAAAARAAAAAVPAGCAARIYDTRKTIPGWRRLDKAAVKTGGAENHRFGLFDAVLIKDNHVQAAGSVGEAVRRARAEVADRMPIEVEIDRLQQLEEAIAAGADIVLLDNFDVPALAAAVQQTAGRVELEASGGVTLERIPAIAKTGVDRISLGALTHTVKPAELGLDFLEP